MADQGSRVLHHDEKNEPSMVERARQINKESKTKVRARIENAASDSRTISDSDADAVGHCVSGCIDVRMVGHAKAWADAWLYESARSLTPDTAWTRDAMVGLGVPRDIANELR